MIAVVLVFALRLGCQDLSGAPDPAIVSHRDDTTFVVVPEGTSAKVPLGRWFAAWKSLPVGVRVVRNKMDIAPSPVGRRDLELRSYPWFDRHVVRIDVVPHRSLPLRLRPVGTSPVEWRDSATLGALETELVELFRGTGIHPTLAMGNPLTLPPSPSFWDPDGDGHLDLVRNAGSEGAPELDSLDDWIAGRKLSFPDIILLQSPVRVGWSLGCTLHRGDSLLELANQATLPWRDAKGIPVRYVVRSKKGANPDTFVVEGYESDSMRIRTTGRGGRWSRDHAPETELVWRPDHDIPAFGISSSRLSDAAPILVLPDAKRLEDPRRAARVLAREIGHRLGLDDVDAPQNPMSGILRLDIRNPTWLPEQVLKLHESLKSYP